MKKDNQIILSLKTSYQTIAWSITKNQEIIKTGIRVIKRDINGNKERREARIKKRNLSRKKNRINDLNKLLDIKNINIKTNNILETKIKALNKEVTREELYFVLKNYLLHRGVSNILNIEDDTINNLSSYKNKLIENNQKAEEKSIAEIQKENLLKEEKYRGLNNIFNKDLYRRDIIKTIRKNKNNHLIKDIEDFEKKFLDIFDRKRKFYEGPGKINSPTIYGIYKPNGEIKQDIFQDLKGKCRIYENEIRAISESYNAQKFNLLNDLNNTKLNKFDEITPQQKKEILEQVINTTKNISVIKIIEKVCNTKKENISGYRISSDGKPEYTSFKIIKKLKKSYMKNFDKELSIEDANQMIDILNVSIEKENIQEMYIKKKNKKIEKLELDFYYNFLKKNSNDIKKYHSLSDKIILELMEELENTNKSQRTILLERNLIKNKYEIILKDKNINIRKIEKNTLNKINNKTVKQEIKEILIMLNLLLKEYDINKIIVNTPKEITPLENKKNEQRYMDYIEKIENETQIITSVVEEIKKTLNVSEEEIYKKIDQESILLYEQQKRKCLITGKDISILDLINKTQKKFIIPIDSCLDQTLENKILMLKQENSNVKTIQELINDNWTKKELEEHISHSNMSKEKIKNILNNKIKENKKIIDKNKFFSDQSYTQSELRKIVKAFKEKNSDKNIIEAENISLEIYKRLNEINQAINDDSKKIQINSLDYYRKEILLTILGAIEIDETIDKDKAIDLKNKFMNATKELNITYKLNKNKNKQFSKKTIYSTRDKGSDKNYKYGVIQIYEEKVNILEKFNKVKENLILKKADLSILEDIIKKYPESKNPFLEYKEENGYIQFKNKTKPKRIKYYDKKIEKYLDITHKYINPKNKLIFNLRITPYKTDVFFDKKNNLYKLIKIDHIDFISLKNSKFNDNKKIIDKTKYIEKLKNTKSNIEDLEYKFSLFNGDIIEIKRKDVQDKEFYKFVSSRNENQLDLLQIEEEKRKSITLHKKIEIFKKKKTNEIGNIIKKEEKNYLFEKIKKELTQK